MFGESAFNQPLATFNTANIDNVRIFICVESNLMRRQFLISLSPPLFHQMNGMFLNADSFNQDISNFDTSRVTDVSVIL